MAAISKDEFLKCLSASKVVDEKYVEQNSEKFKDLETKQIARALIRDDILTKWQAQQLLSGRSRFHVGSYRLLERIRKDKFGDRFFAIHEQLDRLVEIQFLPTEFNKDEDRKNNFLKNASKAATLDHPNLMHVYDIDQEKNRFYLVVEHSKGDTLDSFEPNELGQLDIARIVEQTIRGLGEAHRENIVHGGIKETNLLVTDQEQVKILNLAMSSLLIDQHEQVSAVSDLQATGKLGLRLMKQIDGSDEETRKSLANIFQSISSLNSTDGLAEPIKQLSSWIVENEEDQKESIISAVPIAASNPKPVLASKSKVKKPTAPLKRDPSTAHGSEDYDSEGSFIQRNPIAILASAAGLCLAILGITAWVVLSPANGDEPTTKVATAGMLNSSPQKQESKSGLLAKANNDKPKTSPIKNFDPNRPKRARTKAQKQLDMQEALEKAKADLAAGKIGGNENGNTPPSNPQPQPQKTAAKAPPKSNDQSPKNVADNKMNAEPKTVAATPPVQIPVSTAAPAAPNPAPRKQDASQETASKPQSVPSNATLTKAQLEKPFQSMPKTVDLGDITKPAPVVLGKVFVPKNILMACELIFGRSIAKSKLVFELERSPTDKQRWFVNFKRRKNSKATKIGEFFRDNDQFKFSWAPDAAEEDLHNYLRNCILKLTGQNQSSKFVTLRSPVAINGLAIMPDKPTNKVSTDVQWLPNPDDIIIEVGMPSYSGTPKMTPVPPTRRVTRKEPVRLFMTFDHGRPLEYVFLETAASAKKTLTLQQSLFFNIGGRPRMVDQKGLDSILAQVANESAEASRYVQIGNQKGKPANVSRDDFMAAKKEAEDAAEDAKRRLEEMTKVLEAVKAFYGKHIPLRVYFKIDNHQIVLAESKENK